MQCNIVNVLGRNRQTMQCTTNIETKTKTNKKEIPSSRDNYIAVVATNTLPLPSFLFLLITMVFSACFDMFAVCLALHWKLLQFIAVSYGLRKFQSLLNLYSKHLTHTENGIKRSSTQSKRNEQQQKTKTKTLMHFFT